MRNLLLARPDLVPALEGALRIYDTATARHSARVAEMATITAVELGLDAGGLELTHWAAQLHDLGKLAVPAAILHKPGPLSAEEWEEVARHPGAGADLLLTISDELAPLAAAVRSHHECWDGSGYPDGLAGDDIPLAGRIVALADVYDSITRPRPYRNLAYGQDAATVLIRAETGAHFDPTLAKVFLGLLQGGAFEVAAELARP